MELSAHVWKLGAACAQEEDNMKQTRTTGWYTLKLWIGIKDLSLLLRPCLNPNYEKGEISETTG
jgi:hypothetical protein